jgi:hypothetical protein
MNNHLGIKEFYVLTVASSFIFGNLEPHGYQAHGNEFRCNICDKTSTRKHFYLFFKPCEVAFVY